MVIDPWNLDQATAKFTDLGVEVIPNCRFLAGFTDEPSQALLYYRQGADVVWLCYHC